MTKFRRLRHRLWMAKFVAGGLSVVTTGVDPIFAGRVVGVLLVWKGAGILVAAGLLLLMKACGG